MATTPLRLIYFNSARLLSFLHSTSSHSDRKAHSKLCFCPGFSENAVRGRAEVTRLMLAYAGYPYEDVRITGVS